jgi:hypothetical protein
LLIEEDPCNSPSLVEDLAELEVCESRPCTVLLEVEDSSYTPEILCPSGEEPAVVVFSKFLCPKSTLLSFLYLSVEKSFLLIKFGVGGEFTLLQIYYIV